MVLALFLYLLLEQYSIPVDSQFLQQLCMGMLLSPDMNNTASADMEKLAFHFPTAIADKRWYKQILWRQIVCNTTVIIYSLNVYDSDGYTLHQQ